ncbi:MAG: hypothetical protein CSA33_01225 [Desulfobulbus propionicus]|nr:MAG: hypothetical protein CSA33_01225 [Desulfobulbus propionicus]
MAEIGNSACFYWFIYAIMLQIGTSVSFKSKMSGTCNTKGKIMRCPKCGYISFDHLEHCKKCRKPIGALLKEIQGTTYDVEPPRFLHFASGNIEGDGLGNQLVQETEELHGVYAEDMLESLDEISIDMGEDEEIVSTGEDGTALSLDDLEEASEEEFILDLGEQESADEEEGVTIDFGDLDISDLAPPQSESEATVEEEECTSEPDPVPDPAVDSLLADLQPVESAPDPSGTLEDLILDEAELTKSIKPLIGKRNAPSVKTGTALDNFEVDLGELFSEEKV